MNDKSKQIVRVAVQIFIMVVLIGALFWYVGIDSLISTLAKIQLEYLFLAFMSYFGINLLFTVRLRRILKREGISTSFGKTLLAQYAGMLSSDVTPGRSGYFLMPVYLRDQNVPASASLSGILGIQTIEFLFKVFGGVLAIVFLVQTVNLLTVNATLFALGLLGIALMLIGAVLLAALTWSQKAISLFNRIANSRFLSRFTGGLMGKLEQYKQGAQKTRRAIPEIVLLTSMCWVLKGFEWYFLGTALGITQIGWLGFFLLHPLITALGFVPLTPSGIGFQEGAIIVVFTLLGINQDQAFVFALMSRVLLIIEDLVGVTQIAKSTSGFLFSKNLSAKQSVK